MIGVATAYTGPVRKIPRISKLVIMDALCWRKIMMHRSATMSISTGGVTKYNMRIPYEFENPFPTSERDISIRVAKRDIQISTLEIIATTGRSY